MSDTIKHAITVVEQALFILRDHGAIEQNDVKNLTTRLREMIEGESDTERVARIRATAAKKMQKRIQEGK